MKDTIYIKKHLSSSQIIIFGFLSIILIGTILLMLPFSSTTGQWTGFLEALFTSTSAVCVTGLIVFDTATHWSFFGQLIILILIQIGGMGVVTVAVAIATISGKKISLMQRSTMQEAISAPKIGGIVKLTNFILKTTLFIELVGVILMFPVFLKDFGLKKGIWYSIFHSISAFCNAGFDLMGIRQSFSSLVTYQSNIIINIVIMLLIIIGGIGFLTWMDIYVNKQKVKKYHMQSKVILMMTGFLIIIPTIFFFFFEFSNDIWNNLSFGEKILGSFFQAVTPRTAGFNTVDLNLFSEAGKMVMILLMLIGGSPGSTAGGMKTTTMAVLILTMFAIFKKKEDTNCFGRRIANETIKQALAILLMYFLLFLSGAICISMIEKLPIITCLFETASAIGTVGLTLGITPSLTVFSKLILINLMFFGRVGGLTLAFATFSEKHRINAKLPKEKITVG